MMIRRAPHLDALDLNAETVVLLPGQATLLSPLSSSLWRLLDDVDMRNLDDLEPTLVAEHGQPPDPSALTNLVNDLWLAEIVTVEVEFDR